MEQTGRYRVANAFRRSADRCESTRAHRTALPSSLGPLSRKVWDMLGIIMCQQQRCCRYDKGEQFIITAGNGSAAPKLVLTTQYLRHNNHRSVDQLRTSGGWSSVGELCLPKQKRDDNGSACTAHARTHTHPPPHRGCLRSERKKKFKRGPQQNTKRSSRFALCHHLAARCEERAGQEQ